MKLTDDNLDYPDCRPPRTNNSIEMPERIRALIAARRAARGELSGSNRDPEQATTSRSSRSWALNSCSVGIDRRLPPPRRGISIRSLVWCGNPSVANGGGGGFPAPPRYLILSPLDG